MANLKGSKTISVATEEAESRIASPATGWGIVVLFLLTILIPSIAQHVSEVRANNANSGKPAGSVARVLPQFYDVVKLVPTFTEIRDIRGVSDLLKTLPSVQDLKGYSDALERESIIINRLLPKSQYLLTAYLGVGNEQAYCGKDGWLFYRPDVDYLTVPGFLTKAELRRKARSGDAETAPVQPNPLKAILHFDRELKSRGIRLIIAPVPAKPSMHPEKLSSRYAQFTNALQNSSYQRFKTQLESQGIPVVDVSATLLQAKLSDSASQYLGTDTHWTPAAMELAAGALADAIQDHGGLSRGPAKKYVSSPLDIENLGDAAVMLKLPRNQKVFRPQKVTIHQVRTADGKLWKPSRDAEILLLGDSFTNIYSLEGMGWGRSAGLAEHISHILQRPVDKIAINAGGAYTTRQRLNQELVKGIDRLEGKRVVVYQFAVRELVSGDWKLFSIPPVKPRSVPKTITRDQTAAKAEPIADAQPKQDKPEAIEQSPAPSNVEKPKSVKPVTVSKPEGGNTPSGEERGLVVSGVIQAISKPPNPGTVPYKDCVIAVHLTDIKAISGSLTEWEILVLLWGMRDNGWTKAASYQVGQCINLKLAAWDSVESKYGSYNRIELDSDDAMLLDIYWGE